MTTKQTPARHAGIGERNALYFADANTRFEAMAAAFHERTGMMAPGKDDCLGTHPREDREAAWLKFAPQYTHELLRQANEDVRALRTQLAALAQEREQLIDIINMGGAHPDMRTLRNVQYQKNRVVSAAIGWCADPSDACDLMASVRELERITAPITTRDAAPDGGRR